MLTSSANQYLRPEYLTPLPTTLDAKKSPLALLAQTCSQIGADTSSTKSLIPPLEKINKGNKSDSSREKISPASSSGSNSVCDVMKTSFKPYESNTREKTCSPEDRGSSNSSNRDRTPVSSSKSNNNTPVALSNGARCNSNHSASSPRSSPAGIGRKTPAHSSGTPTSGTSGHHTPPKSSVSESVTSSASRTAPSPIFSTAAKSSFAPSLLSGDSSLKDFSFGAYKPGAGLPSSYLGGYPVPGAHFPMDVMASSLLSQHHLKQGLNPYISYARMKSAAGGDTLVPVCRDPYCTGCQLSSQLLASAAATAGAKSPATTTATGCPGGCAQCEHATAAVKAGLLSSSAHTNPTAAAAYAHAQLAALAAASQLPYVCNWIAGDAAYCGKRFATSEELLQHLRTHTSLSSGADSTTPLSLLSPPGLPPTHPLFHRTYPTPPLSPLATARYHPYSKPSLLPPSLSASSLGFPIPSHPGIPPYFSPYSLYGQRLGASSAMHP